MGLYRPGIETFDSLKGLQGVVGAIRNPDEKLKRVADGVKLLGAGALLGHLYLVTAREAYVGPLGQTGDVTRLTREMTFISELDELRYLLDPDVPVDTLMLDFASPEAWYAGAEDIGPLRDCRLQVPVLSLATAVSAEIGGI